MNMPVIGRPIRKLGPVEAAFAAAEGPNKAAQVAACKTYMEDHIVPALRVALDEWHVEVHAKLHQWFTFTDIKVSHFRWMHLEGQPPRARMIDAGSARVSISNEKPTETINASLWLSVCDGLNLSNTPSEKAASERSGIAGGSEPAPDPATPAPANKHPYPPQAVPVGVPSHPGTNVAGTGKPINEQPRRQSSPQMSNAGTNPAPSRSSGSNSSGCECLGINCKCLA
ncbi:hypothetical protein FS842_001889 [Serendipita sp. 407]|nr:hypothetical protein FS842_001889 [Serendipita sp. 407]